MLPRTHPFRPSQKPRVRAALPRGGRAGAGAAAVGTLQLLSTWAASLEPGCCPTFPHPCSVPRACRKSRWMDQFCFVWGQVLDAGIPLVLSVCPPAHQFLPGTKDCANGLMASGEKMVVVVVWCCLCAMSISPALTALLAPCLPLWILHSSTYPVLPANGLLITK